MIKVLDGLTYWVPLWQQSSFLGKTFHSLALYKNSIFASLCFSLPHWLYKNIDGHCANLAWYILQKCVLFLQKLTSVRPAWCTGSRWCLFLVNWKYFYLELGLLLVRNVIGQQVALLKKFYTFRTFQKTWSLTLVLEPKWEFKRSV